MLKLIFLLFLKIKAFWEKSLHQITYLPIYGPKRMKEIDFQLLPPDARCSPDRISNTRSSVTLQHREVR